MGGEITLTILAGGFSQSQPASAKLQNVFEEFTLWSRKV